MGHVSVTPVITTDVPPSYVGLPRLTLVFAYASQQSLTVLDPAPKPGMATSTVLSHVSHHLSSTKFLIFLVKAGARSGSPPSLLLEAAQHDPNRHPQIRL